MVKQVSCYQHLHTLPHLPNKDILLSLAPTAVDTPLRLCAWARGGVETNGGGYKCRLLYVDHAPKNCHRTRFFYGRKNLLIAGKLFLYCVVACFRQAQAYIFYSGNLKMNFFIQKIYHLCNLNRRAMYIC